MHVYKPGEKGKGICYKCKDIVSTIFRYAPLKYKGHLIPDVLQDFCDVCGSAVSIPHQSSYRVREFIEEQKKKVQVNFRIPLQVKDVLVVIGQSRLKNSRPNMVVRVVSEFYLSKLKESNEKLIKRIRDALDDSWTHGPSRDRLSCLLPDTSWVILNRVSKQEHINRTKIVEGIIITAKQDLLDSEDAELSKDFEAFAGQPKYLFELNKRNVNEIFTEDYYDRIGT